MANFEDLIWLKDGEFTVPENLKESIRTGDTRKNTIWFKYMLAIIGTGIAACFGPHLL